MSDKLENDHPEVCYKNVVVVSQAETYANENLTVVKSDSFDSEFDLLESTLSGLKQDEHESVFISDIIENYPESKLQPNSISNNSIITQNDPESFKAVSTVMSSNSCHDTSCLNWPDCTHKHSLQSAQHSKSPNQKGILLESLHKSNIFSYSVSNSIKSEITNRSIQDEVKKPVLLVDFDQTRDTRDETECDRQHSSVSLDLRGEELSLATKHSDNGCDFDTDTNKYATSLKDTNLKFFTNSHRLFVNNSVKYSSEVASTMNDSVVPSVSCHPEGSNNDSSTKENSGEDNVKTNSKVASTLDDSVVASVSCPPEGSNNDLSTNENSGEDNLKTNSEVASTMDDCGVASVSCHPEGSNNDSSTKENSGEDNLTTNSEVCQLDNPQLNEYEHQEKETEIKDEKTFNVLECNEATPKKLNCEIVTEVDSQVGENVDDESIKKQGIISSTPNVTKKYQENTINKFSGEPDFGLVSPLDVKHSKSKQNLKRKYIGLQPIEEIDEDNDTMTPKKVKVIEEKDTGVHSVAPPEASTSSTIPCFEAPAKSLLKKWQPSCLSRNISASTFIVLDECGETEFDDCSKVSQEHESSKVDDFEIACQSLTEELMKSSSNIETLEKYHSQVQLENQMDDEKFDEILKELTMNVDLDDQTFVSLRSMDESTITDPNKTSLTLKAMEESVDNLLSESDKKEHLDEEGSSSENNKTVIETNKDIAISGESSISGQKIDSVNEESVPSVPQESSPTDDNTASEQKTIKEEQQIHEEELDEEDYLLEGFVGTNDKPYEFFEFVSSDPKENEDNYNPEWQTLGRLTSDEERYKAVRDRWRSLVPPDPNRNLTYRQWRRRNNKSPIKLSPLNNNHQMMDDHQRNQLCTAVFDDKITKIVQELEDSRMNIYRQRNREFEELGHAQDSEQMRASMSGYNYLEMAQLHTRHLNQCRAVKNQYDQELKRIQDITEDKIRILREASEEVLLFQKFYKGVGARDDTDLYMTDIQVQELMETEEMLERYNDFYK